MELYARGRFQFLSERVGCSYMPWAATRTHYQHATTDNQLRRQLIHCSTPPAALLEAHMLRI